MLTCIYTRLNIPPWKCNGFMKDDISLISLSHVVCWVILTTNLIIDSKLKLTLFLIVQGCYSDNHLWNEVLTYSNFWRYIIHSGDSFLHHLTYNYYGYLRNGIQLCLAYIISLYTKIILSISPTCHLLISGLKYIYRIIIYSYIEFNYWSIKMVLCVILLSYIV